VGANIKDHAAFRQEHFFILSRGFFYRISVSQSKSQ